MLYLSNRVYLELDRYITAQGRTVIVGEHAASAIDLSSKTDYNIIDTKETLSNINLAEWIASLSPAEDAERVIIFADNENYLLLSAFSLSSVLANPTISAISEIIDLDLQYIKSESAYPSSFFEYKYRGVEPPAITAEQVTTAIQKALTITPKLTNSIPRLELQFANFLNGTLNAQLAESLNSVANSIVKKTAWAGKDFAQLSNGLPAMLKMTDGLDLEDLELDDIRSYYPAYWRIWNVSIPDTDEYQDLTEQDYINYLKLYESHFEYIENAKYYQTIHDLFTVGQDGLLELARKDLLDPTRTYIFEGIKGRLLQKINSLLWYKISANNRNPTYLAQFELK
jgi:hypothetical protein